MINTRDLTKIIDDACDALGMRSVASTHLLLGTAAVETVRILLGLKRPGLRGEKMDQNYQE